MFAMIEARRASKGALCNSLLARRAAIRADFHIRIPGGLNYLGLRTNDKRQYQ
jgi:hypothetical protein